jgi:hypothetical protein
LVLLLTAAPVTSRNKYNAVGWYDSRDEMVANVPPDQLNLSFYTHVVYGGPDIEHDGTIDCTPFSATTVGAVLRNRTKAAGAKMLWVVTDETASLVSNNTLRDRFLATALPVRGLVLYLRVSAVCFARRLMGGNHGKHA